MKIHDATAAPNPRRVRIFIAEKGIEVPYEQVDIVNAINRGEEFRTHKNPMGTVPVLELDDGTCIAESGAICRYFEELHPDPPLMGVDAQDKAIVEMWNRRMEFELLSAGDTGVSTTASHSSKAACPRCRSLPRCPNRQGGKESGLAGRSFSRPPIYCGRALHRSRHCRPVRGGFWPGSKNCDPAGSKNTWLAGTQPYPPGRAPGRRPTEKSPPRRGGPELVEGPGWVPRYFAPCPEQAGSADRADVGAGLFQ